MERYFLQNGYVGNSVLWWKKNKAGYTTDIREAHIFTKEEAYQQNEMRGEDRPWPVDIVLENMRSVFEPSSINKDFSGIWSTWKK